MICELNSKALVDDGTELIDDDGWTYKSTNYSNVWVCSFIPLINKQYYPRDHFCSISANHRIVEARTLVERWGVQNLSREIPF